MKVELGYTSRFEIRQVTHTAPVRRAVRIAYLSDFHLNRYGGALVQEIIRCIDEINPDILLLGGDYVDTKQGLPFFDQLLESLSARKLVFGIAGNHDYFFGIDRIKTLFDTHHIPWIEQSSVVVECHGTRILISNTATAEDEADVRLACLHEPAAVQDGYHIVLAGHLHGCQVVLWQSAQGLYPGKWFYKWNILQAFENNTLTIVSKGLGDTLPFRYNCPKDIILLTLEP